MATEQLRRAAEPLLVKYQARSHTRIGATYLCSDWLVGWFDPPRLSKATLSLYELDYLSPFVLAQVNLVLSGHVHTYERFRGVTIDSKVCPRPFAMNFTLSLCTHPRK